MTFQLIKKDGRLRGIAIMLGNGLVLSGSVEHRELWRICDLCQKNEAIRILPHPRPVSVRTMFGIGLAQAPRYELAMHFHFYGCGS